MLIQVLFYMFAAILVLAALGVILARNPVYCGAARWCCASSPRRRIWLLLEAEFLAIVLVLVYVGAVMVLFLFVVMMLDINLEELRQGFTRFAWLGWLTALAVIVEIVGVVWARGGLGIDVEPRRRRRCRRTTPIRRARARAVHALRLSARDGGHDAAGGDHRGHRAHPAPPRRAASRRTSRSRWRCGAKDRAANRQDGRRRSDHDHARRSC